MTQGLLFFFLLLVIYEFEEIMNIVDIGLSLFKFPADCRASISQQT